LGLAAGAFQDVLGIGGAGRVEAGPHDGQDLGGELVFFAIRHVMLLG
jgi:hypothetical protein